MKNKYFSFLFKEVDASTLSLFRIIFGAFMFYQMIYYYKVDYTYQLMAGPEFLFHYPYLEFLVPLPDLFLKTILAALVVSTILIAVGVLYRYALTFFFLGFSYFSFIDKTIYNNHLYLIALIAFVMIFMEADKKYSLKRQKKSSPKTVPNWNIRLLQFLFLVVYFYGGLSKLSADWLNGSIAEIMYTASQGSFLHELVPKQLLVGIITFGGLIYDLMIGFLLLYRPTRKIGFILVLFFNITNGVVLFGDIGLFPYFMIFAAILFFESEKVGKFIDQLFSKNQKTGKKKKAALKTSAAPTTIPKGNWDKRQHYVAGCLAVFVIFQLLFPLRYLALTDNPDWTGIGSRFAWRMKMQSRKLVDMKMTVIDRTTEAVTQIDHASFLSANQYKHMIEDPYAVIQFAKYIHKKANTRGMVDPIVKASIMVSFNGRTPQLMINPDVDLSRVNESPFASNYWISPLKE